MAKDSPALTRFKKFVEDGHTNNGLEEIQLTYELFISVGEKEFKRGSFLEIASKFSERLRKKQREIGENRGYKPFKEDCISYLLKNSFVYSKEVIERITYHLQSLPTRNPDKLYLSIIKDTGWIKNISFRDELISFGEILDCVDFFNGRLRLLAHRYNGYKNIIGFYAFQQIGAIERIPINRHKFKRSHISTREGNFLCVPSLLHFSINPAETILLFVSDCPYIWVIRRKLNMLEVQPKKIYLLVFEINNLSEKELYELKSLNFQLVVTKSIKEKCYPNEKDIISLEELLRRCKEKARYGRNYKLSTKEKEKFKSLLQRKKRVYDKFPLLKNYYQQQIIDLKNKQLQEINSRNKKS